ncbi:MAG: patatin-like phospholipase family protein [Candidatus Tyrphobacter sp.]
MKALVLSGGGALGAFEAGAIQALTDGGYEFNLICGTSIGAINAALVCQDKVDELTAIWKSISKSNVIEYVTPIQYAMMLADEIEKLGHANPFGLLPAVERWMQVGSKKALLALRGIVKPDSIEQILSDHLDFNEIKRSLIVTATNLTYGSSDSFFAFVGTNCNEIQQTFVRAAGASGRALSTDEGFRTAVRASAAIPGFFAPVPMSLGTRGEKEYVDGGVANNVPVTLAAMAGATDVVVILLQPQATNPSYVTATLEDIALASYTVVQQQLLRLDMEIARSKGVNVTSIQPSAPLTLSLLGFADQNGIDSAFELGYAAVRNMP